MLLLQVDLIDDASTARVACTGSSPATTSRQAASIACGASSSRRSQRDERLALRLQHDVQRPARHPSGRASSRGLAVAHAPQVVAGRHARQAEVAVGAARREAAERRNPVVVVGDAHVACAIRASRQVIAAKLDQVPAAGPSAGLPPAEHLPRGPSSQGSECRVRSPGSYATRETTCSGATPSRASGLPWA